MIQNIEFQAARDVRKMEPIDNVAIISIHDNGSSVLSGIPTNGWGYFGDIGFDDAAYSLAQIEDYNVNFWNYFEGCATKIEALKILIMFKEIEKLTFIDTLIVHCDTGRSRSVAVAKYYAEKRYLPLSGDTETYNTLMYQLLKNPDYFEEHLDKFVRVKAKKNQTKKDTTSLFPFGWIDFIIKKLSKQ